MRRLLVLSGVLAGLLFPAAALADDLVVLMPGRYFEPPRSTIVAGDRVVFRNTDLVTHDVRVADGLFDSGPLGRGATWAQEFAAPGEYGFVCTLHAFMSGHLSAVPATLVAPDGVLAGQPLKLSGRAPAGTPAVTIERAAGGAPWEPVATATPAADGTYATTAVAAEGAAYRPVTPAGAGAPVMPKVTARIDLHLTLSGGRLRVHAMPAPAGMVATLQVYDRWRYRWRGRRTARLDAHGGAAFRVPVRARTYARVVLRRRGGRALVASDVLRTSDGRRVPDPATLAPPGGGGGHHGGH